MSSFQEMGLCPEILRALEEAGYTEPTPIQEQAIPHALLGKDLMGGAQTGTGKTAAFSLPILHRFRNEEPGHIRALILVPTRELAIQVGRNIRTYGAYLPLRSTAVYGGVPMGPQEMMLRHGVDVLVATPGRLKDHMWRGNIDYRHTSVLVLDEADRMLDMGFIDDVREIVREIPTERQSLLFSATLAPEIRKLARDILVDPIRIEVAPPSTTAAGVEQVVLRTGIGEKRDALHRLLRDHERDRTLVFTRTKRGASNLSGYLKGRGWRCTSIHSDKSQAARTEALNSFRDGRVQILVATDIAARGLDVTGISHVINFDLPHSPEDYVHRIGRTARAGRTGVAISLMGPEESRNLAAIERHIGRSIRRVEGTSFDPMPVIGTSVIEEEEAPIAAGDPAVFPGNPRRKRRRSRRRRGSGEAPASTAPAPRGNGTRLAQRPQGSARTRPAREHTAREHTAREHTEEPRTKAPKRGGLLTRMIEKLGLRSG